MRRRTMGKRFCEACGKPNYNKLDPGQRWTCTYCNRYQLQRASKETTMTSRDFCYWLQGYFEILRAAGGASTPSLNAGQVQCIQKHLAMVFKHEIDPSMTTPGLDELHET